MSEKGEGSMASCKICGQPVTCGLVVHDGCYEGMAAENAQLRAELERLKRERDAAVECIDGVEDALNFGRISGALLRVSEWRGPQKEE